MLSQGAARENSNLALISTVSTILGCSDLSYKIAMLQPPGSDPVGLPDGKPSKPFVSNEI
jgi:hypothetical protein